MTEREHVAAYIVDNDGDVVELDEDFALGWSVDDQGNPWPLIIDRRLEGPSLVPMGRELEQLAPHERTGRLPVALRERIAPLPRCGRIASTTGRPCRTQVAHAGDACHHHQTIGASR